jgi:hypothetical protein
MTHQCGDRQLCCKLLPVQPLHKHYVDAAGNQISESRCGTRALSSKVKPPAAGRSDANLNRTHAPAIACIDAPFHDVAAVLIIVVIGVVRIIVIVVVGIGSVQTEAERGTDEDRPAEAMVKAALVKSTGPEVCEPTRPESCTTVEGAGTANGCRAERPGCTSSGWTETGRAEATAPGDCSETPASCHWSCAEASASAHRGSTKAATSADCRSTEAAASAHRRSTEAATSADCRSTEAAASADCRSTEAAASADCRSAEAAASAHRRSTEAAASAHRRSTEAATSTDCRSMEASASTHCGATSKAAATTTAKSALR